MQFSTCMQRLGYLCINLCCLDIKKNSDSQRRKKCKLEKVVECGEHRKSQRTQRKSNEFKKTAQNAKKDTIVQQARQLTPSIYREQEYQKSGFNEINKSLHNYTFSVMLAMY